MEQKKKQPKKTKGKGKNRAKTDEEAKAKELKKIEKARKRREEQELIEKELEEEDEEEKKKHPAASLSDQMIQNLGVDDDFEDDAEVQNAPSTRRAKSQSFSDTKSPFYMDNIFSFSEMTGNNEKEVNGETIEFEVPTKSSQLERDMRSMNNQLIDQRNYLRKIEPRNLKSIFKSSIETDHILNITAAFNSVTSKWLNSNLEFLVNFMLNLTKVDRFGIAVGTLTDDEKQVIFELITKLENAASVYEGSMDDSDQTLEGKLEEVSKAFE